MKLLTFGAGNMASALIIPMAKEIKELEITAYTPTNKRAEELANLTNGTVLTDLKEIPTSDFYFLGCKPQQVSELAKSLKNKLCVNSVIVSMLAGVTTTELQNLFNKREIVRVMPNTPCLYGEGVILTTHDSSVPATLLKSLMKLLKTAGKVYEMEDEDQFDYVTGITGSGPGYIFEWARILALQLEDRGFSSNQSKEMIVDLFYGAATMMKNSEDDLGVLCKNVTSKKGVTQAALDIFKEGKFEVLTNKAVAAAYKRTKELSQG